MAKILVTGSNGYIGNWKMDFVNQDVSIDRAISLLGCYPKVKFAEGLKIYYDYIKE